MAETVLVQSLGGMIFTAVLRADHTQKLTLTEHPVQTGASITDHAYLEPAEVILEVGESDCELGDGGSARVFGQLLAMQAEREPLEVVTRLKTYENMLIESIETSDDYTTQGALKATVTLREIIMADAAIVQVSGRAKKSADRHKTDKTNRGEVVPEPIDEIDRSKLAEIQGWGYVRGENGAEEYGR